MELLQLKYFQTVARLEHMTNAAKELNVSQPSLSNAIMRLEQRLGVPLFVRQGRNIRLNAFGKKFLNRVERVFLELDEGERELADMAGADRGTVSIAVTLPSILPTLLKEFLTLHPGAKIMQRQAVSIADMRDQLDNAEVDLCISTTKVSGFDIEWLPLMEEEIFLSVPNGHRFASRTSIALREAADEPFIALTPGYGFRSVTDEFCNQAGFRPNIAFELEEAGVSLAMVQLGIGIAFAPSLSYKVSSYPGTTLVRISEPVCKRTIGIAWHKKRFMSQAAVRFRRFATEFFNTSP